MSRKRSAIYPLSDATNKYVLTFISTNYKCYMNIRNELLLRLTKSMFAKLVGQGFTEEMTLKMLPKR